MMLARDAHRRARALLAANRECLDDLAANALERETLSREDLDEIFAAHELRQLAPAKGSGAALVAMARERRGSIRLTVTGSDSDADYYFPPGGRWPGMVHGERSVGLLYGQRALLIGALEPLTYTGTMLSTRAADKPFKRLARTAKIQETVFLGTRAEADKVLAGVHRLHETDRGRAAGGRRRPRGRRPLLGLRPGADALDPGGDRRLRPGDVRNDGAAAEPRRARGALAGLRPLRRALRPARAARCPAATASSRPGSTGRLASPDLHATPHALEMAPLVAFEQPVPGGGSRQPRDPEPHHQGHPAAARPGDLRDPLEPLPTRPPSARSRPPTAAPAAPSRAHDAPRPQRRTSSTSSARPSTSAAAPRRRSCTPAPPEVEACRARVG